MVKVFGVFVDKEDLSALLFTWWLSHALRLMHTVSTVIEITAKLGTTLSAYYGIFAAEAHHIPSRTTASHSVLVKLKHRNGITGFTSFRTFFTFLCLLSLIGLTALKERVATTESGISDVAIVGCVS